MDAGCGSGLLTKLLAQKVPRGKVFGVDIDSNMIKQAKRNIKDLENVELVQSDIADVKLHMKLDVIFSYTRPMDPILILPTLFFLPFIM